MTLFILYPPHDTAIFKCFTWVTFLIILLESGYNLDMKIKPSQTLFSLRKGVKFWQSNFFVTLEELKTIKYCLKNFKKCHVTLLTLPPCDIWWHCLGPLRVSRIIWKAPIRTFFGWGTKGSAQSPWCVSCVEQKKSSSIAFLHFLFNLFFLCIFWQTNIDLEPIL